MTEHSNPRPAVHTSAEPELVPVLEKLISLEVTSTELKVWRTKLKAREVELKIARLKAKL